MIINLYSGLPIFLGFSIYGLLLPRELSGKKIHQPSRRHEFDLWVETIPWRRKWQPTPVFLPGKSHGQRSLVGHNPRCCKDLDMTYWLKQWTSTVTCLAILCASVLSGFSLSCLLIGRLVIPLSPLFYPSHKGAQHQIAKNKQANKPKTSKNTLWQGKGETVALEQRTLHSPLRWDSHTLWMLKLI